MRFEKNHSAFVLLGLCAFVAAASAQLQNHHFWKTIANGMQKDIEAAHQDFMDLFAQPSDVKPKVEASPATSSEEKPTASAPSATDVATTNDTRSTENDSSEEDISGETEMELFKKVFGRPIPSLFSLLNQMSPAKQWWQGEHVCVNREEKVDQKKEAEADNPVNQFFLIGSSQLSSCRHTPNKYICTTTTRSPGLSKIVTVTYECCHGYRRIDRTKGCVKVDLKEVTEVLSEAGASTFGEVLKKNNMQKKFSNENVTWFIPADDVFKPSDAQPASSETNENELRKKRVDDDTNEVPSQPTPRPVVDVRSISDDVVMASVAKGLIDVNDVNNEQVIESEDKRSKLRMNVYPGETEPIVTVNCARIKSPNHLGNNSMVHIVDRMLYPVEKTLKQLIIENKQLSQFKQMLEKSGDLNKLEEDGHFTVFAPSNTAFDKLDAGLRSKYLRGQACANSVARHHLIPHSICSAAIVSDRRLSTRDISGDWLALERTDDNNLLIGNKAHAEVIDLVGTNGVLYVINKVLAPSSAQAMSQMLSSGNHTTFLDLVNKAGLMSMLDDSRNTTIFVPSEKALDDAKPLLEGMDTQALKDTLLYHMTSKPVLSCDMSDDMSLETSLPGKKLHLNLYNSLPLFSVFDQTATVQCARVLSHDMKACESYAHEIDKVMIPPKQTVLETLAENQNLSAFNSVLKDTKLEKEIQEGTFTVLAPSNSAFEKLPAETMEKLKKDKEFADEVLRKHVLTDSLCCSGIGMSGWIFTNHVSTLAGRAMEVKRDGSGSVLFGPMKAVQCDNTATNGLIHVVDKVMVPSGFKNTGVKFIDQNGSEVLLFGI
nr:PREDICTED: transforming growth factor-beta-induced protein ig-h3 [Bemisia tabaci]